MVDGAKERQSTAVVDQPGGAAAVLLKVWRQPDVRVGYLHYLATARVRDYHAGESKADPNDSFVLPDRARAHTGPAIRLEPSSEHLAIWGCCMAATPVCALTPTRADEVCGRSW